MLSGRPTWWDDANCAGELDTMYDDEARALAICAGCTVRRECLAAALVRREPDGVWGGFTTTERERIMKSASGNIPGLLHNLAQARSSNGAVS